MRQSTYLLPTLREAPTEAETVSHRLMVRAGFIRQLAAGIYTYLPMGWRVLRKVEEIVRQEMDRAGAQEILMPAMQPAELWQESGRYEVYGPELIRLRDRHDREFALGPTHEEVVTTLMRNEVRSYRKLPMNLYQIQTKFRDERRPRFGLLRGREFLMKDAYSFDADWEGLNKSYWAMYEAYNRIFTRCGLNFRAVEADAGAIGGEGGTHEFMALADIGEDTIAVCSHCDYAANLEKAEAGEGNEQYRKVAAGAHEKFHTPGLRTIDQLTTSLGLDAKQFAKTLIYLADGQPVAVVVRGDHEANEIKIKNFLNAIQVELADTETTERVTGAPVGYAGPVGLSIPILVDRAVAAMPTVVTGANEKEHHLRNVQPGVHFTLDRTGDFRNVIEGDQCPRCAGTLQFYRGIEVGHVFKLGTKYSEKLGAVYLDQTGSEQLMVMGCYGIGVSRVLSAIIEQSSDEHGMRWPLAIAPFHVHLIPVSVKDETQMALADQLYERLQSAGVEVLMDDRDERPGVKFKDSDLVGIPIRITVGKGAADGVVEYKERDAADKSDLSVEEAVARIMEKVRAIGR
ncbi:proline--tRNA ligase [Effusibacillus dendaii]|uniref:Proline--tRNA ligase n=1 Tax=Effusibacillus dendaii TaxID=2743772 RepID=A0A7I8D8F4_9BACL|nr:proline--tRNA ligase [Effusibacillus dendaii]BCJ85299.1 proline--tRNA ligase [Effusibacillus dendaii]